MMSSASPNHNPVIGIIGASGFIGFNLSKFLSNKGYCVKALSRQNPEFVNSTRPLNIDIIDLHSKTLFLEWLSDVDYVIDCASSSTPSNCSRQSAASVVTKELEVLDYKLECCLAKKVKKYFFFSSGGSIYGHRDQDIPAREDSVCAPFSSYGLSKLYSEQFLDYISKHSPIRCTSFRLSNPYGRYHPSKKKQGIINIAIKNAIARKPLTIYGDPALILKDYIHIDTVSEIVDILINSSFSGVVNIGSGIQYSLKDIINVILGIDSGFADLITYESSLSFDNTRFSLDTSLLDSIVGGKISPKPLDESIIDLFEWQKTVGLGNF